MDELTSIKPGFRVIIPKQDSKPVIEVLCTGRGCSLIKKNQLALILLGEVLDENGFLTGSEILRRYQLAGTGCAANFDGSFVLIILSENTVPTLVITDPLNSLKCFLEETPESYVLVSSLSFLPRRLRELDRIGVTSFLANGVIFNHRTVFENVRSLDRASIHTIDPEHGIASKPYWRYTFDHAFAKRSRAALRDELASLLLRAAERRIRPDETIYLSLSGGYDSTCILGLLSQLSPPRVECFSYVTDQAGAGSDEMVAAQMARIAGFPHRFLNSFNHDLLGLVRRNVEMGECRSNFCGELDAWQNLQGELPADGVFFVGDECFGWTDCRLNSDDDLLASIPIHKSGVLGAYADCINLDALGDDFNHEIRQILETAREPDLHDSKDFIYLDQRLGNVILPWRELFAGRHCPVRNLLLDRQILDLMSHLPSSLRRGKKLYKETVRQMFPELFGVKRAFRPTFDYLTKAIYDNSDAFQGELLGGASLADRWLQPEKCAALCKSIKITSSVSWKTGLITFGKKLLKENRLAHSIKGGLFPPTRMTRVSPSVLLLRILTLREYLRQ